MSREYLNHTLFVPAGALLRIAESPETHGAVEITHVDGADALVLSKIEWIKDVRSDVTLPSKYEALNWDGTTIYKGQWLRTSNPDLHLYHRMLERRPGHLISYGDFRSIAELPVEHPGALASFVITHAAGLPQEYVDADVAGFAAWRLTAEGVHPLQMVAEPASIGVEQLVGHWPIEKLAGSRVLLVGAGSIGGAAALSLAAYGVGKIDIVDPDRLLFHNTVRHVLGPKHVGRMKTAALRSAIQSRWPTAVGDYPLDVVEEAHLVHELVSKADVVLCAADGVAPRRVVSHLGKRHKTTSILACVLDDGAFGELIRIRPGPKFGCLLCHRAALLKSGGFDAETSQETPYAANTGDHHRPMTAVGSDLHLVGTLAAKITVATILQALGEPDQSLPGEHAVVSLRPTRNIAAPFDSHETSRVDWHPRTTPRPDCITCSLQ